MQPLSSTANSLPISNCARELLDAVPSLFWYVRLHMRRHRQGLTVPQFRALVKIRNEPETSLSAVAEHLGSSLPTASRTVATLVSKGLLARSLSCNDRRQCSLTLTHRGRQIVDDALAATQAQMESELAGLSAHERAAVRDAMLLLRGVFEEVKNREAAPAVTGPRPAAPLSPSPATPRRSPHSALTLTLSK